MRIVILECVLLKNITIENVISKVVTGSIADRLGVIPGDKLIAINGHMIEDVIDYRFLTTDEHLEVLLNKPDGSEWIIEIDKEYDDDIGIEFENPVMAETRQCSNKCVFCFIDQMPPNLRAGLYIKDDDSRLSFLQGNYITLTNMKPTEIEKLIRYHISPLNISVHTTNPELRRRMLNNRFAGKIMEQMKLFGENDIKMNVQIVLCPGYNDGDELDRTLSDLESVAKSLISVAVVPVGITKFQKNTSLLPVDQKNANEVVNQIHKWQAKWLEKFGRKLVYPADEFYLKANGRWPKADEYEAFFQLENGVGMLASFEEDLLNYVERMPIIKKKNGCTISIATGVAAAPYMKYLAGIVLEKIQNVTINILPIINEFFGKQITVSGLVTGQDLVNQLGTTDLGHVLMIPQNMLKSDEDTFLDDMTLSQAMKLLNVPVKKCGVDGKQWVKSILRESSKNQSIGSEKQYVKTNCCRHRSAKCR